MVIPASWLPRLPLVTSTYEISQPSAARRAIVPPQINSASSGWAIITNIRCPPGGSKTVDVVVMIVAFLPSDQIGRRGEPFASQLAIRAYDSGMLQGTCQCNWRRGMRRSNARVVSHTRVGLTLFRQ